MFPDVVILAGGLGKRLHPVTGGAQKVLATIGDQPFLEILIDYIASQGGARFILCVGHGSDKVEAHFKKKCRSREIIFSRERTPLGTGGAIKQAVGYVKTDCFLAMNGDCFCMINYKKMIAQHKENKAKATIAVTLVPDARDYGTIIFRPDNQIEAFKEKQPKAQEAYVNTGTYCLNRDIFSFRDTANKFSIEHDFFPYLMTLGFYVFIVENKLFIDIGTPERYSWAQKHLKALKGQA